MSLVLVRLFLQSVDPVFSYRIGRIVCPVTFSCHFKTEGHKDVLLIELVQTSQSLGVVGRKVGGRIQTDGIGSGFHSLCPERILIVGGAEVLAIEGSTLDVELFTIDIYSIVL